MEGLGVRGKHAGYVTDRRTNIQHDRKFEPQIHVIVGGNPREQHAISTHKDACLSRYRVITHTLNVLVLHSEEGRSHM